MPKGIDLRVYVLQSTVCSTRSTSDKLRRPSQYTHIAIVKFCQLIEDVQVGLRIQFRVCERIERQMVNYFKSAAPLIAHPSWHAEEATQCH